ncbi:hypothetical protein ACG04Q_14990 [Roseateles sp. DXS20W]|uniref:Sel1 repeat family protein n=1 Tax=Pelomonas lactea TaxID=3299030 RepID=A0ABW7GLR9_9BURK
MKRSTALLTMLACLPALLWLAVTGDALPEPPAEASAAAAELPAPPLPAAPADASQPVPATLSPQPPATSTTELCGSGRFALSAPQDDADANADAFARLPAPVGRLALQELQDRLLPLLAAGDARQRAAAWLLRQPADGAAQAAWAAGQLAEAHAGGDAQALRWAASACAHTDDASACRLALARARVNAEPDNGLHWLALAQEAPQPREQAQAWQGIVQASAWREYPAGLTATTQAALSHLRPAPAGYLRARLARDTLGPDAAQALDGADWLVSQCAHHRSDCAQVADRIAARADSAALLQLAATLGRQLDWPQERLDAVSAVTQAFHTTLPAWQDSPLACGAVDPQLAHVDAVAQRGEVPRTR